MYSHFHFHGDGMCGDGAVAQQQGAAAALC